MSTEHQQYSTENQAQTIREYAEQRDIKIIKTYSDDAKSGVIIGGRGALQQLIADVESGTAGFSVILVYDVTRWGRFQDPDEAAYYEFRCRRAGMRVAYCAEQFENDGSPRPARLPPAPARPRPQGSGPMPETIGHGAAQVCDGNPRLVRLQNADDLVFREPAALHLWSFRLGQRLPQSGLGAGGNVSVRRIMGGL